MIVVKVTAATAVRGVAVLADVVVVVVVVVYSSSSSNDGSPSPSCLQDLFESSALFRSIQ